MFRKSVPSPSTEKSYRRLAFLVAAIIEIDGATALQWLRLLIPPSRKVLSKESRSILGSVLFGERVLTFGTLVHEADNPAELLRICDALFDVASDPTSDVSAMTRSRLASALLEHLGGPDAHKDHLAVADLRSKIIADAQRWPPALRDQVISSPQTRHDIASSEPSIRSGAELPTEKQARKPVLTASMQSVTEVGSLPRELAQRHRELCERLDALAHEIELVRRASERIGGLADVAQQLQAHCDSTSRDLHRAQDSLRILETERDKAKTDSAREIQRVHDLAAALEQVKQDAENERRRLALQISANATGRLDEFKNRLGFHLSRLVVDLPDKTTPVSAELGKVLLLQFHQFLDALREEGIETLSRRVGS